MNKLTKLAAAVTLSAIVLGYAFPTEAFAQTVEQNQELNQTVRVNCTSTGAYGQNINCNAEGTQRGIQHQRINGVDCVIIKNKCIPTHKPVDASVTPMTLAGIITAAAASAGAGFLTIKKRK